MPLLSVLLAAAVAIVATAPGAPAADDGTPIAGGWRLLQQMPMVAGPVCVVRTAGPDVNTSLLLNKTGIPVLITARPDWMHSGPIEATVSIDGEPARKVQAQGVINLVMVLLPDPTLVGRLRAARTLDWAFPFGRFRAGVAELGAALDALAACEERKARATTPAG